MYSKKHLICNILSIFASTILYVHGAQLLTDNTQTFMTPLQRRYEKLLKDKSTWTHVMLELAELQVESRGPIDELVDAIQSLKEDVEQKLNNIQSDYIARTEEHQTEVRKLTNFLDRANNDASTTSEFLQNVLYVQRTQLTQSIDDQKKELESAQKELQQLAASRQAAHDNYLERIKGKNEALVSVDEALKLLGGILNGEVDLLQVSRAPEVLQNVQKQLKGGDLDSDLMRALIVEAERLEQFGGGSNVVELSENNGEDQSKSDAKLSKKEDLQKVVELLVQIRQNLVQSLARERQNEAESIQQQQNDVRNKNIDIAHLSSESVDSQNELDATNEQISAQEEYAEQRRTDAARLAQSVDLENAQFEDDTSIYNEFVAQLQAELDSCAQSLDLIENSDFPDFLVSRMESEDLVQMQKPV